MSWTDFPFPMPQLCLDSYRKLEDELVLADLLIIEKKMERLAKMSKKAISPQETAQNDLLPKLKECLEAGKPLRTAGLPPAEILSCGAFRLDNQAGTRGGERRRR